MSKANPAVWEAKPEESIYDATPAVEAVEVDFLLANGGEMITLRERTAFEEMRARADEGGTLSPRQRAWVKRVQAEIRQHFDDLYLLDAAIGNAHDPAPFEDMREKLTGRRTLTEAQRDWAERIANR